MLKDERGTSPSSSVPCEERVTLEGQHATTNWVDEVCCFNGKRTGSKIRGLDFRDLLDFQLPYLKTEVILSILTCRRIYRMKIKYTHVLTGSHSCKYQFILPQRA